MIRTDVHSPSNLVTEDYEYAYSFDAHPTEGNRSDCVPIVNMLIADGFRFDQVYGDGKCDHCGANIRYRAVLKHLPSRTLIQVGETCLDNRFELASEDFHRLRKAAELNRSRRRISNLRAEWMAIDSDREIAFAWATFSVANNEFGYNGIRHTFVSHINRYGTVSDKFVRAIMRDMAKTERIAEERASQKAKMNPVVEGKGITITGTIVSIKIHENDYGIREVMTVRDDRGFLVWGTQPASLYDAIVGSRVSFIANIEKSDRDETFGFFKRPRKAIIES
jgi:hypothetical protein